MIHFFESYTVIVILPKFPMASFRLEVTHNKSQRVDYSKQCSWKKPVISKRYQIVVGLFFNHNFSSLEELAPGWNFPYLQI